MIKDVSVRRIGANEAAACIEGLADLLIDCVEGGASVTNAPDGSGWGRCRSMRSCPTASYAGRRFSISISDHDRHYLDMRGTSTLVLFRFSRMRSQSRSW
jgi:hypothetical protein